MSVESVAWQESLLLESYQQLGEQLAKAVIKRPAVLGRSSERAWKVVASWGACGMREGAFPDRREI